MSHRTEAKWEGWVHKKGSIVPSWKRRYMVLQGKEVVYYDQQKSDFRAKEKGSMVLTGAQRNNEIPNGITLRSEDGTMMQIYTDSTDEFVSCYNAMIKAVGNSGLLSEPQGKPASIFKAVTDRMVPSMGNKYETPQEIDNQSFAGWLEKEGDRVKTWKRRYFVLVGKQISYYEKCQGEKPKGGGIIESIEYSDRPFGLVFILDSNRKLNVAADSDVEMRLWLIAICKELSLKTRHVYRPPKKDVAAPVAEAPRHYSAVSAVLASIPVVPNVVAEEINNAKIALSAKAPEKSKEEVKAQEETLAKLQAALQPEDLAALETPSEALTVEKDKVEKIKKRKEKRERGRKIRAIGVGDAPRSCCIIS